uniref:Uncharacterized protein n=1 Tax=Siphoviridae sp. ctL0q1 TaxID=2825449 RepID=A0A8S5PI85_9CAUD|nr:MAG TPA: hypothetical protein [Siphoviridae sp. ctL0q1]
MSCGHLFSMIQHLDPRTDNAASVQTLFIKIR